MEQKCPFKVYEVTIFSLILIEGLERLLKHITDKLFSVGTKQKIERPSRAKSNLPFEEPDSVYFWLI